MQPPILRTGPSRRPSVRFDDNVKPPCPTPSTSAESSPISVQESCSGPFFEGPSVHTRAINDAFSEFLEAAGQRRGVVEEEIRGLERWRDALREECRILEETIQGSEARAEAIIREAMEAKEESQSILDQVRNENSTLVSMSSAYGEASTDDSVSIQTGDTSEEGSASCHQVIAATSARTPSSSYVSAGGEAIECDGVELDADEAVERGEEEWARGDHDAAMKSFQAAFAIERARNGRDHPDLVDTLQMIGLYYTYEQKWDDAVVAYGEKLRIQKTVLGKEHESVAETLCDYIGEVYVKACQFENAIKCFKEAARIFKAIGNEESKHNAKKGVAYAEKQLAYQLKYDRKQQKYSAKQELRRRNRRLKA